MTVIGDNMVEGEVRGGGNNHVVCSNGTRTDGMCGLELKGERAYLRNARGISG